MTTFQVDFTTSRPELDVILWFEDHVTHEHEDFVLRYRGGGYYSARLDSLFDRDLVLDNEDFDVIHAEAAEIA